MKTTHCQACNALIYGMKSRLAFGHTCGRTLKEIAEYVKENSVDSVNSRLKMMDNMPKTITDISHEEFIP